MLPSDTPSGLARPFPPPCVVSWNIYHAAFFINVAPIPNPLPLARMFACAAEGDPVLLIAICALSLSLSLSRRRGHEAVQMTPESGDTT